MLGASVSRTPRTHKHTTGTCVSECRRPTPHSLIGIISSRAAVRARTSRRPATRRRRRRRRPRRPRYVGERPVHVIGDCADAADAPASRHVPRRRVSLVSTASDRGGPGCGRATGRLSWGRPLAGPVRVPVRTHTHTRTDRPAPAAPAAEILWNLFKIWRDTRRRHHVHPISDCASSQDADEEQRRKGIFSGDVR
jgi:hypothetical protein